MIKTSVIRSKLGGIVWYRERNGRNTKKELSNNLDAALSQCGTKISPLFTNPSKELSALVWPSGPLLSYKNCIEQHKVRSLELSVYESAMSIRQTALQWGRTGACLRTTTLTDVCQRHNQRTQTCVLSL